ncbi:hypothetical protein AeNC1_009918 [Aphanomyces euteiches]|nr:hypothetical protein AeNC1_009918 [Aphanomyces euteiches]
MASPARPKGDKPRITLMERQDKETGNAPMLAQLRITELDKLVARVKQKQALCNDLVLHYTKELEHIDKECKKIHERYDPLCKRLEQRLVEQETQKRQYEEISKSFGDILNTTKSRLKNSQTDGIRNLRREANMELTDSRGFAADRDSTFKQKSSRQAAVSLNKK